MTALPERGRRRRAPSPSRRIAVGWCLVLVCLTVFLAAFFAVPFALWIPHAGAQPRFGEPTVEVIDQSAIVGRGESFSMQLGVEGLDLAELTIEITVHEALTTIEGLDEEPGSVVAHYGARPMIDFFVEPTGVVTVRVPTLIAEPAEPVDRTEDRSNGDSQDTPAPGLVIGEAGVYPLVVTVSKRSEPDTKTDADGGGTEAVAEATVRTTLVRHVGEPAASDGASIPVPMPLVVVVDIGGSEGQTGSGGLSIEEASEILAEHPNLAVTILIRRAAIGRLQRNPELATRFASAVDGRSVVGEPLHRLDPSALAAIGQWRLYRRAGQRTRSELLELGLTADSAVTVVTSPISESASVALIAEGFRAVLDATGADPSPAAPGRVTTVAGELVILPVDRATTDFEESRFGGATGDGHRWLAELILAERESTVMMLGGGLDPINPARPILEASKTGSWFETTALSEGLAGVLVEPRSPAARPSHDLSDLTEPLAEADRLLATYSLFYVDGPHSPSDYLLALSDATTVEAGSRARRAAIEAVSNDLLAAMEVVSLPGDQSVTLAARSASIPLAIENASDGIRLVELRFRTDRLVVQENEMVIAVPPGSSVIDIEVEARSLGASPLAITVMTPDGQRSLASTRFQVRSTAVPGLGLLLSIGGLSMLGIWWYLSIRRNRTAHPSRTGDDGGRGTEPLDLRPGQPIDRDAVTAGDSLEV